MADSRTGAENVQDELETLCSAGKLGSTKKKKKNTHDIEGFVNRKKDRSSVAARASRASLPQLLTFQW